MRRNPLKKIQLFPSCHTTSLVSPWQLGLLNRGNLGSQHREFCGKLINGGIPTYLTMDDVPAGVNLTLSRGRHCHCSKSFRGMVLLMMLAD